MLYTLKVILNRNMCYTDYFPDNTDVLLSEYMSSVVECQRLVYQ